MIAAITFILVLMLSMVIVRVATVALTLTGLSRELARFQARSAFTGCGFTTAEAEKVINHPVRRRIIMLLMLLGNAGIVTAVASLMLTMVGPQQQTWVEFFVRLALLIAGVVSLFIFAHSRWIDRWMTRLIRWALTRWTDLEARDYGSLLHLSGNYAVIEMSVRAGDWLADRSLIELDLSREGILILGIDREDGSYVGAPRGQTKIHAGDTLLMYGRRRLLTELDERPAGIEGALEHVRAMSEQLKVEKEEKREQGEVEQEDEAAKEAEEPTAA